MVALRKRQSSDNADSPLLPPVAPGGEGESVNPAQEAGDAVVTSPVSTPLEDQGLQARLRELQDAERAAADHMAAQKVMIQAQMQRDTPPPEPPKFSERDLQFLGARPGIEKDQSFCAMAASLPRFGIHWDTPEFYRTLAAAFPLENYRRVEQPKPDDKPPAFAEDDDRPSVSAPISRSVPSGGRYSPTSTTLSADERAVARAAGMSDVQYARQKLLLLQRKAAGLIQDGDG
jgi:hypothetical protein